MARTETLPIGDVSDGDSSLTPKPEWRIVTPPTLYLEKLGALWAEKLGVAKAGVTCPLDRLPDGYRLYERPRPGNSKIVDKHLWGNRKKYFDSPNRFWPHFLHLQEHQSATGCPCTICRGSGGILPSQTTRPTVRAPGRPPKAISNVPPVSQSFPKALIRKALPQNHYSLDEERIPDTIRGLINQLKKDLTVDQPIEETLSMDWRAERDVLPLQLKQYAQQKAYLPRVGEIVLFLRHLPNGSEVCMDNATQEFKIWNNGKFEGHPSWEAGVIGQVPDKHELIKLQDAIMETDKEHAIGTSGYRVEPLLDATKYKYVPLHQTRPFVFWKEYLAGSPHMHPSVDHAMKAMASVALINRQRFKGQWPVAVVYCGAAFVGSELICVGDTIRLLPAKDGNGTVEDVLWVEAIKLRFANLDRASSNDYDEGHPYMSSLHIVGKGFTLNPSRGIGGPADFTKPSIEGYDKWYLLHHITKQMQVSFTRVLGRCFEAEPMLLWFPNPNPNDDTRTLLSHGLDGMQQAREYSSKQDSRILPGKTWFWADTRAEALDIRSLNHADVSYHDDQRDERLDEWKNAVRVLERNASMAKKASMPATNTATDMASDRPSRGDSSMTPATHETTTVTKTKTSTFNGVVIPAKRPATSHDELDGQDATHNYDLQQWIRPTPSTLASALALPTRSPVKSPVVHMPAINVYSDEDSSQSASTETDPLAAFIGGPEVIQLD